MQHNNEENIESFYTLVENQTQFEEFINIHKNVTWLTFDTEFIGEKRYEVLLCLIQVMSEFGVFIIDTLKIEDISKFNTILCDPEVLKVTHSGYNDLKIFYQKYKTLPKNIFDTQIAASFIGYKYPISFQNLVEGELNISIKKAYTVTKWDVRPIEKQQMQYAYEDVFYLKGIWDSLTQKLTDCNRLAWAIDECKCFENEDLYNINFESEYYAIRGLQDLSKKNKLLLYRALLWRNDEAKRKNISKEMVLPFKLLFTIASQFHLGNKILNQNRHLQAHTFEKYAPTFDRLLEAPMTKEEENIIRNIPTLKKVIDPKANLILGFLKNYIEWNCLEKNIAVDLLFRNDTLKNLNTHNIKEDELNIDGWRKEIIGAETIHLFKNSKSLHITPLVDGFQLQIKK
ncbi:MAG: hypothetical protein KBA06_04870 [Saprospiraceae bacterium]|nr:hypothetical protein [Saprospiraceae bacterium]